MRVDIDPRRIPRKMLEKPIPQQEEPDAVVQQAVGRRVNTLCQGEDGLQHQLVLFQTYHNFGLPHASLRQLLLVPEPTHGTGAAKRWRPCTPAMAAGLTDHG